MAEARNRDLALLHHLQQGALHLGGRAVDLVGQQQVGEYRAQRGGEVTGFLVVNPRADQVGRHQIRRELNAFKVTLHRAGQSLDGQRFGQTGHAFHQQVALRQDGHHDALQKTVLSHHHTFDLVQDLLHQLGGVWIRRVVRGHGDQFVKV